MAFWNRSKSEHQRIGGEPQPKRISTPAGQRLSIILENGTADAQLAKARDTHRASVRKSGLSPALADIPRESMEDRSADSSGYSYSVWSDGEKKFNLLRNHRQVAKRGGWKRLAILLAVLLVIIVALGVGLGLGLKKKKSSDSSNNSSSLSNSNSNSQQGTHTTSPGSPTATAASSPSSTPSDFPKGSYSLVTFLDTVQTNCTANPATWSCYPYNTYYTDASKAVATFNWIISGSAGAYKISSTQNPFSISFQNADLDILDQGKDAERYRFQISQTKTVSPSTSLTDDNASVECDYPNTNLQAYLYTKMAKEYPDTSTGDPSGDPTYTTWPFAVRVEQVIGGGENVPSCYKLSNGKHGDQITNGLEAQYAGSLCSCLYKNWHTPS